MYIILIICLSFCLISDSIPAFDVAKKLIKTSPMPTPTVGRAIIFA